MRSAGVFVLAFFASAIAGMLAFGAVSFLPDWDDAAGRGLGQAFRALLIAVYVILGIVLYGLAAWRSNRERHMKRAFAILLLIPFLIVILGVIDNGIHRIDWLRETAGAVQMFTPLWTVALVQWLILHICLSRPTASAKAASI
jgi:uncharacterized membrane protein